MVLVVASGSLLGVLLGCAPAASSLADEEKEPHVVRAMQREAALDYSGAIESYQRALEVNPRSSIAHFRLAFLYVRQNNDPAAAIYHFQQFLKLRPTSEHATVIRQHIAGCKQELAKEFALGPLGDDVKVQLDELIQQTQQLKEDNQKLADENRRLRDQLNILQPGRAGPGSTAATTEPTPVAPRTPRESIPPRTPTDSRTYIVQRGDTYYSIAKRHGIKPSALEAANPGVSPNHLNIGQTLVVPAP
jgi:LysM repeat protein